MAPAPDTVFIRSIFTGHELHPGSFAPKPAPVQNETWILSIFLFLFVLLAWLRTVHGVRLKNLFSAFTYKRYLREWIRDEQSLAAGWNIALILFSLLSIALFIYCTFVFYQVKLPGRQGVVLFGEIAAGVLLIYAVKFALIRTAGFVLNLPSETGDYAYTVVAFFQVSGIVALPFAFLSQYLDTLHPRVFILSGLLLLGVVLLFRTFRAISAALASPRVSPFYLFLYLCTLEILPIVVLIKMLANP